jgi:D-sedoheptulose 7-phosphate isomerase
LPSPESRRTALNDNGGIPDREGSEYDRLFYPFLFEGGTSDADEVLAQVQHSTVDKCLEVIALRKATLERNGDTIVEAGAAMARAFAEGATLFAFGNGGSTTDAQDIVADLADPPFPGCAPLPAIALTNDIAVITAVGNDVGFENVFVRQVIALARSGDIAVGITTSGESPNVLAALEQAKKQGLLTIGLAGYDGGKMARSGAVDYCIVIPGDHVPRIQEAQATAYHALLEVVWALVKTGGDGRDTMTGPQSVERRL